MRCFLSLCACSVDAGDAAKTRGQMIERKIEALEDMATRVRILAVDISFV